MSEVLVDSIIEVAGITFASTGVANDDLYIQYAWQSAHTCLGTMLRFQTDIIGSVV